MAERDRDHDFLPIDVTTLKLKSEFDILRAF